MTKCSTRPIPAIPSFAARKWTPAPRCVCWPKAAGGLHILATDSGRQIFVCGHMEYDRDTLRLEYERDVKRGLPIAVPENYFEDDDPAKGVVFRWRSHANLFFSNWLNYYVYQETPYDLEKL